MLYLKFSITEQVSRDGETQTNVGIFDIFWGCRATESGTRL